MNPVSQAQANFFCYLLMRRRILSPHSFRIATSPDTGLWIHSYPWVKLIVNYHIAFYPAFGNSANGHMGSESRVASETRGEVGDLSVPPNEQISR